MSTMTRRRRWLLITVVTLLLALAAVATGRAVMQRRGEAAKLAQASKPAAVAVELAPGDIARATRGEMSAALAVTGSLKAVNSAIVKAKVAGELQEIVVREGDRVTAGQLLGRLDATEYQWRLRQAEDQVAAAASQLEIAERTLANNRALVNQGFISQTALETSLSSATGARATLQAARAAAELARKAVKDAEVRAPLAGLVAQRLAQPGERIAIDGRLLEIVDLSRIELEAAVAAEDVVSLRIGQKASLRVDGLDRVLSAKVVRLNPSAQSGTRAVMAYLDVETDPALRQGLFARANVELRRSTALAVPVSAVRSDQSQPYVLVAVQGQVSQRTVTTGARGEMSFGAGPEAAVELLSGLSEGETVLRGTVGALRAGTLVSLPAGPAASAAALAQSR